MKPRSFPLLAVAFFVSFAAADGKPPSPAKSDARPSPAADAAPASLLRWLLLQNGGPDAAAVPWPEIVRAAGGRQISSLDPANAADAATLTKLGAALDAALPRLNRPDGPLRGAPVLTVAEAGAGIADELRTALSASSGSTVENLAPPGASYPVLRWTDGAGGRACYLFVATYPAGGKDGAIRVLTVRAADLAGQFPADGVCLLVGVEHNGKSGRDLALLNWEAIDLARVTLRCAVTFEADANSLHAPGATVTDSRRGRD